MSEAEKFDLLSLVSPPVSLVLPLLLQDKSTGQNIIFATDAYGLDPKEQISQEWLLGEGLGKIQPRVAKSLAEQSNRTRQNAEVFTPSWLCNKMNNFCDEAWLSEGSCFNRESGSAWCATSEPLQFATPLGWQGYVASRRLEITCGEAPYLVSRYDTVTGDIIEIKTRIGLLDRKLRVASEKAKDEDDWLWWAEAAFQSVYAYEFQGDNLLIARINLLATFAEYCKAKLGREASKAELAHFADIITWNTWQMDGLTGSIPFANPVREVKQGSLFDDQEEQLPEIDCKIKDWQDNRIIAFNSIRKGKEMKFDFVIGNPPYQETKEGTSDMPIYNIFMDETYKVSDKVELITPGRFLFDAGKTPKTWNRKMLNDPHLKVLFYEQDSSKIFQETDIKGGIAITYRDVNKNFGAIEIFTHFQELNSILAKVKEKIQKSFPTIIYPQNKFNLNNLYRDYPELQKVISSDGRERRLTSGCMNYPCFHDKKQENDIQILGLKSNKRVYRFINKNYLELDHENLHKWKVILPKSNGSGAIGEVLSTPLIGQPLIGHTQTFISIGKFETEQEANNALKYVKTKFARTMLGVLKVTQDNKKDTWKYVPLQDFTQNSDIDWSRSIAEIDRQLYAKYHLTDEEITFIETKVREMN